MERRLERNKRREAEGWEWIYIQDTKLNILYIWEILLIGNLKALDVSYTISFYHIDILSLSISYHQSNYESLYVFYLRESYTLYLLFLLLAPELDAGY